MRHTGGILTETTITGTYADDVKAVLADLEQRNIVGRIWQKDHSVWKPEPTEITNRLGWLDITAPMGEQSSTLESFAAEVRGAGFQHAVLLGMGGSSLGAEVLQQVFGSAAGYPRLIVLDCTLPARVQAVAESIDLMNTLFLVSSKSGTTVEPNSLFRYFKDRVASTVGKEKAGNHFVAITDFGTSLSRLAEQEGFRRCFINPPDVGGRYSVLSYFGLVPAALIGVDTAALLNRADRTRRECGESESLYQNPGVLLGAIMGTLARLGRDKLTLLTSPSVHSFGLWVEQLVAESTGKNNKGIVPVVGEPLLDPVRYGDDRLFVCLRMSNDDNLVIDKAVANIKASRQPLVILDMEDRYDLGAEFFRWEFATAVAGAVLGIHPFDQPDIQAAKQATEAVLREYTYSGKLPPAKETVSPAELLAKARSGYYLAILAYVPQIPEVDAVTADLRLRITEKYGLATTLNYGPRYLHSTGQLHKGGPNTGLFLMVTTDHENDIPIPGSPFTFGVLADAQALGDLKALQSMGRRVARVNLSQGNATAISKSLNEV